MRLIRWLYPGLRIKRWLLALLLAAAVFVLAVVLVVGPRYWDLERLALLAVYYATGRLLPLAVTGAVLAVLAAAAAVYAIRQVVMSIVQALAPATADGVGQALYLQRQRDRGPRVVAIGGGTGLSTLLRGLKAYTANITAIVTVADDGGSSGRLRGELGILPPGDLRNCLAALAETEPLMTELFQHRFERGSLAGHTVGNVLIGALTEITGDFVAAVSAASRVLAVRGRVLPSTVDQVQLVARLQDGREVRGESAITAAAGRIAELRLVPSGARALPEAVAAVAAADLIVIGPGSLYTSILPNLLLPELADAVRRARGTRLFVVNMMTQPGETGGFTAADHLAALQAVAGPGLCDAVVVNTAAVSAARAAPYRLQGAEPVRVDRQALEALGVPVVAADLAAAEGLVRHDPDRLAALLLREYLRRAGPPEPNRLVDHYLLADRVRRAVPRARRARGAAGSGARG
jgi:uncharacterized cofD-like protein